MIHSILSRPRYNPVRSRPRQTPFSPHQLRVSSLKVQHPVNYTLTDDQIIGETRTSSVAVWLHFHQLHGLNKIRLWNSKRLTRKPAHLPARRFPGKPGRPRETCTWGKDKRACKIQRTLISTLIRSPKGNLHMRERQESLQNTTEFDFKTCKIQTCTWGKDERACKILRTLTSTLRSRKHWSRQRRAWKLLRPFKIADYCDVCIL